MTDYIKTMRRYVGHMPIQFVGASIVIVDGDGRLLLQKRHDNHLWAYHGGCVEAGEAAETAAKRELLEETGLIADEIELYGVYSGPEMYYVYANGDEANIVDVVYLCRKWHGELKPQASEVDELRWFAPDELPDESEISPPNRMFFREYRGRV